MGDVEAGDALLTILKHRMPEAQAEALAIRLVSAAMAELRKTRPAVPGNDEDERYVGPGEDSTTPLPPNDGGSRQATGGEHHSLRQPRRPETKRWQTGPWIHLGAVHDSLR